MSNHLIAVFDISGSTMEYGKSRLLRNMARTLRDITDVSFDYYSLSNELLKIEVTSDIPMFKPGEKLNLSLMADFIKKIPVAERASVIFFSDFGFSFKEADILKDVIRQNPNITLITVPCGIDAQTSIARYLSDLNFSADNVLLATDYAVSALDGLLIKPYSKFSEIGTY